MTKKYIVTKRVYYKVENTYWEEFEMTQDRWEGLYSYAKEHSAKSVEHLSEKMTDKIEDWKLLWSILPQGEYQKCDEATWGREEYDEERTFIDEVKK